MDDLEVIINRTALIESLLNQAIVEFCNPKLVEFDFFWTVLLNSSIMPALLIISQSGKVTKERREDALATFDASYEAAKKSLAALIDHIRLTRPDAAK